MHVRYFYNWGYFHPITCGSDVVATNHLDYFRERGWTVDCILSNEGRKAAFADQFRAKYSWLRDLTMIDRPPSNFTMRDYLFAFEHCCTSPRFQAVLGAPTDLFLTNYVFSTPLLPHVPRTCKRILETQDLLATQFAMAERLSAPPGQGEDPLAQARAAYVLRTELELYQLFDRVIMINEQELSFVRAQQIAHTSYVPQAFETPAVVRRPRTDYDFDLIFVGSPASINVVGMSWFYRHVYVPYLWRHGVRLLIIGGVCPHLDFHDAHITMLPRVDGPLTDFYAATKVVIAPIFEGTGLPIKTLEGMAMGSAVVLTPEAARGFDDRANAYLKVDMKANPRQTAEIILELLSNPERRKRFEQASSAYVRRCFSREAYFAALDRVIESVGLGRRSAVGRAA